MKFLPAVVFVTFCLLSIEYRSVECLANYCMMSCGHILHTVCKRMWKCGPVKDCMFMDSDEKFRNNMLSGMNNIRNRVAGGDKTHKELPTAANMNSLVYDLQLEYIAKCWANTCPDGNDECRMTRSLQHVNQIMWASKTPLLERIHINAMIYAWYKQKKLLTPELVDCYGGHKEVEHVSQLIWAVARFVGCARVRNASGVYLLFCNFGPGGNVVNEPIYLKGMPLSECPRIYAPCPKYKHLCGYVHSRSRPLLLFMNWGVLIFMAFSAITWNYLSQ